MASNETVVSFDEVAFDFGPKKPILDEVSFTVRQGTKVTIMGQNGAGKSTIFKLINGTFQPKSGDVNVGRKLTVAQAHQVMPQDDRDLTIADYFRKYYRGDAYNIDNLISDTLDVVNLKAPLDRIVKSFSGGQQARLLLAAALIQNPDLLLLDEPTNNLDRAGIEHLTQFLIDYPKTVIAISHDADFLNAFTQGVLYLDVNTRKVEQYWGNYYDAVEEIKATIERQNRANAQLEKKIQDDKDKANFFANKGGKMRLVARKMRDEAAELEEQKVDVRREDRTIREFTIPLQEDVGGSIVTIKKVRVIVDHVPTPREVDVTLRKGWHLLLSGPNGIGKSTLLESIANGTEPGAQVAPGVNVGYYRQDFSTLNFEHTVHESLTEAVKLSGGEITEQDLRKAAAGFLITSELVHAKIGTLSEGQKGLVAFCRLMLQKPGLLILDEPTNHINFRHVPVIAQALDAYEGPMILVSHVPEFVDQIRIDETLDLGKGLNL